ncbi:MAG: LUD domain-containing protein, partial [Bacillota bacterium]
GVPVDHTGLADALLEVLGRPGDHPRRPARRLTEEEIRQGLALLTGAGGMEEFRCRVRDRAARAACGITGAEAVVARFGSLVNVESEGNWGVVSNLPPVHVAVVGIDQVVWDYEEALAVVRAVAACAWGAHLGSYVSVVTGPSSTSDVAGCNVRGMHGPRTVHVILLDNGRRAALERGFGELLYCLRCGACLEVCPAYARLGRAFGGPYWGGRGVAAAALAEGPEGARRLGLEACLLDGRCREACPLGIGVPQALARLRGQTLRLGG